MEFWAKIQLNLCKIIRFVGLKLGITSWGAFIQIVILELIISFLWDRVTKMTTLPYIREIGFLVLILGTLFIVGWYMPKLAPKLVTAMVSGQPRPITRHPKLKYDGLTWEYSGGNIVGPFCPDDDTRLVAIYGERLQTDNFDSKGISDYHHQLKCLVCGKTYTLGPEYKTIQQSKNEVSILFEANARRERNTLAN